MRSFTQILSLRLGRVRTIGLVVTIILGLLIAAPGNGVLPWLRVAQFDAFQRAMPRERISEPVKVVTVDEHSIRKFGPWPWPRALLATLIKKTNAQHPVAIGLDIILPEPTPISAQEKQSDDEVLAEAMRHAPVVLGFGGLDQSVGESTNAIRIWPTVVDGVIPPLQVRHFNSAFASAPLFQVAATGQGLISAVLEQGVLRHVPLVATVGETLVPALAVELLRVGTRSPSVRIRAGRNGIESIAVADLEVPTQPDGSVFVPFSQLSPDIYISAADLMEDKLPKGTLESKVVIIGVTALGLTNYITTARGDMVPVLEVHAQIIESLFSDQLLRRPDWIRWTESCSFLMVSLLLVWIMPHMRLVPATLVGLMSSVLLFSASIWLYRKYGLLWDAATVITSLFVISVTLLANMFSEARIARLRSELDLQGARESAAQAAGELNAARRIQMAFLPRPERVFPGESRFELDALLEPAREVGGDLYDFFMHGLDHMFFLVGDVSGKGIVASLFMVVTKALSKSIALRSCTDAGTILKQANIELVRENPDTLFVSCLCGVLDARTGLVSLCNAGHEPPRSLATDGTLTRLPFAEGPPLCALDVFNYQSLQYQMKVGETLCILTDGITEASDINKILYGGERLDAVLRTCTGLTPSGVLHVVREDVRRFVGDATPSDDLTLLILRWNGPHARST